MDLSCKTSFASISLVSLSDLRVFEEVALPEGAVRLTDFGFTTPTVPPVGGRAPVFGVHLGRLYRLTNLG